MPPPPGSSTAAAIAWYARHTPDAAAVTDTGQRISYNQLATDLAACAQALRGRGIAEGMLVGAELRHPRYLPLVLLLACEVIGAATMPFSRSELPHDDLMRAHCDCLLLGEAVPTAGLPRGEVIPNDFLSGLQPADWGILDASHDPARTVRIARTSGTTGRPKALALSTRVQQRIVDAHMDRVPPEIRDDLWFLCPYNFGVRAMVSRALGVLQHGGCVVLTSLDQAPSLLSESAVTLASLMVGDAERIATRAEPRPQGRALLVELIGAAVTPRLRRLVRERLGARINAHYSSNETNLVTYIDDEDGVGTIAADAAVRIVDEAGQDVPLGQTGFILVRTSRMVDGYFHDPELTRAAFTDGWFRTSDVGMMPDAGHLIVLGRADSVLNVGGVKVAPMPIEEQLRQIAGVSDAVLVAPRNPNGVGTLVVAVEIIGQTPPPGLREQVAAIVSRHMPVYEVLPLPWFPRTETGKVRIVEIEAAFERRRAARSPG